MLVAAFNLALGAVAQLDDGVSSKCGENEEVSLLQVEKVGTHEYFCAKLHEDCKKAYQKSQKGRSGAYDDRQYTIMHNRSVDEMDDVNDLMNQLANSTCPDKNCS